MTQRLFTVTIPVTIKADDTDSLREAKQYLRTFFHRIEAGASTETLVWAIQVGDAQLKAVDG